MLKPHIASLINAIVLIAMSAWAYFTSDTPSVTALIPAIFGVLLLGLNPGVRKENKIQAHIAVVLTVLVLFGLIKPFMGAMDRGSDIAMFRVGLSLLTTLVALAAFVKSFIDVRRQRKAGV